MVEFIESPIYANWLQKNVPQNKFVICSPFIVKNALTRLIDFYESESRLGEYELIVVMRAHKRDFILGSSDISAIEYLAELQQRYPEKVTVKIVNNLHMKAYCMDDAKLLITSGNMTPRGLIKSGTIGNVEGGLATDDTVAIVSFNKYLKNIIAAGKGIVEFIESEVYQEIKNSNVEREKNNGNNVASDSLFYIAPPQEMLEYPETESEDSRYKRFEIINNIDVNDISVDIRDFIPQNIAAENYSRAMKFICENNNSNRTMERLAQYLGTTAVTAGSRARKPSGVLKNLKLLGLIESERPDVGILPEATELGRIYYSGDAEIQIDIIRQQSGKLPWMSHIKKMREDNSDEELGKIIIEYLCNYPIRYAESTAARYRPAMTYFCNLNGID